MIAASYRRHATTPIVPTTELKILAVPKAAGE
jgi:hypothetical protein